jgi:hypothetical protein
MLQFDLFGSPEKHLDKLRQDWRVTIENDGGYCPCCDRWGKISPFTLTETHALSLLWLSKAECDDDGWVLVPPVAPKWMMRGKNYSLLAKWGLIEHGGNTDSSKKSEGYWRMTTKGLHFLCGIITVPKKTYIYNNTVQGWSEECVSFRDCFGRHFDYAEVMSDNFNINALRI